MSSDEQFTAKGAAEVGFQTNPEDGPIERGADIAGNQLGVRGSCTNGPGVVGVSETDIGVTATGAIGIVAKASRGPGIEGTGGIISSAVHEQLTAQPGVIGRGGRQPDDDNVHGHPHGPGVLGIGGGQKNLTNVGMTIGSTGVFGYGADVAALQINGQVHGPRFPGAGVVGVGGTKEPHDDGPTLHAPGVVGLSGRHPGRVFFEPGRVGKVGVYGVGDTGVSGRGDRGPGVKGTGSGGTGVGSSNELAPGVVGFGGAKQEYGFRGEIESAAGVVGVANGIDAPLPSLQESSGTGIYGSGRVGGVMGTSSTGRGGIFQSSQAAQVRLVPARGPRLPVQATYSPRIVDDPVGQGLRLPARAAQGDLMAVSGDSGCTLWLCVQGTGIRGVRWAQVLLGPEFVVTA